MNAVEKINEMIINRTRFINQGVDAGLSREYIARRDAELMGMLICLKNINEDHSRCYFITVDDNEKYDYGYYINGGDNDGRWVSLI